MGYHLQQMRGADERGHPVLVIAEGSGNKSGEELTFKALVSDMLATLTAGTVWRKMDEQCVSNIPNAVELKLVGSHTFY